MFPHMGLVGCGATEPSNNTTKDGLLPITLQLFLLYSKEALSVLIERCVYLQHAY